MIKYSYRMVTGSREQALVVVAESFVLFFMLFVGLFLLLPFVSIAIPLHPLRSLVKGQKNKVPS